MQATLERDTMAKPKGRPKTSERDDVTVKLDRALVGKAKLIATHRGVPVAELLSDLAKGPVDKAYAVMLRELEAGDRKGAK
jgi:hypothetical protein